VEEPDRLRPAIAVGRRLHDQNAYGGNVVVAVLTGVAALIDPVERGTVLGRIERIETVVAVARIGMVDEWRGLDVSLSLSRRGCIRAFPIQTVSQITRAVP
jgi:hypothetical protein